MTSWSLGRIFAYLGMTVSKPKMQWNVPANLAGRPKAVIRKKSYDGGVAYDIIEPVIEPVENTVPKRKCKKAE